MANYDLSIFDKPTIEADSNYDVSIFDKPTIEETEPVDDGEGPGLIKSLAKEGAGLIGGGLLDMVETPNFKGSLLQPELTDFNPITAPVKIINKLLPKSMRSPGIEYAEGKIDDAKEYLESMRKSGGEGVKEEIGINPSEPLLKFKHQTPEGVFSGATEGGKNLLEGLLTPENLALIATAKVTPALLNKVVGASFVPGLFKGVGQGLTGSAEDFSKGELGTGTQKLVEAGGTAGMLGFLSKHLVGGKGGSKVEEPIVEEILEPVKEVKPEAKPEVDAEVPRETVIHDPIINRLTSALKLDNPQLLWENLSPEFQQKIKLRNINKLTEPVKISDVIPEGLKGEVSPKELGKIWRKLRYQKMYPDEPMRGKVNLDELIEGQPELRKTPVDIPPETERGITTLEEGTPTLPPSIPRVNPEIPSTLPEILLRLANKEGGTPPILDQFGKPTSTEAPLKPSGKTITIPEGFRGKVPTESDLADARASAEEFVTKINEINEITKKPLIETIEPEPPITTPDYPKQVENVINDLERIGFWETVLPRTPETGKQALLPPATYADRPAKAEFRVTPDGEVLPPKIPDSLTRLLRIKDVQKRLAEDKRLKAGNLLSAPKSRLLPENMTTVVTPEGVALPARLGKAIQDPFSMEIKAQTRVETPKGLRFKKPMGAIPAKEIAKILTTPESQPLSPEGIARRQEKLAEVKGYNIWKLANEALGKKGSLLPEQELVQQLAREELTRKVNETAEKLKIPAEEALKNMLLNQEPTQSKKIDKKIPEEFKKLFVEKPAQAKTIPEQLKQTTKEPPISKKQVIREEIKVAPDKPKDTVMVRNSPLRGVKPRGYLIDPRNKSIKKGIPAILETLVASSEGKLWGLGEAGAHIIERVKNAEHTDLKHFKGKWNTAVVKNLFNGNFRVTKKLRQEIAHDFESATRYIEKLPGKYTAKHVEMAGKIKEVLDMVGTDVAKYIPEFNFRENYWLHSVKPEFYDYLLTTKGERFYAKYLAEQGLTPDEAGKVFSAIRSRQPIYEAGNIFKGRRNLIPEKYIDRSPDALLNYIENISTSLAEYKNYGKNFEKLVGEEAFATTSLEANHIKEYVERIKKDKSGRYSTDAETVNKIRKWGLNTLLTITSSATNLMQRATIGAAWGADPIITLKALIAPYTLKGYNPIAKRAWERAVMSGEVGLFGEGRSGTLGRSLGQGLFDSWLRIFHGKTSEGTRVSTGYAAELIVEKALRNLKANPDKKVLRELLENYGVNWKEALKRGKLSEYEKNGAARDLSRDIEGNFDYLQLPEKAWGSQWNRLYATFLTTAHLGARLTKMTLANTIKDPTRMLPNLLYLLILNQVTGYMASKLSDTTQGREPREDSLPMFLARNAVRGVGGFGPTGDYVLNTLEGRRSQGAFESLIDDATGGTVGVIQGKPEKIIKAMVKHTPGINSFTGRIVD